MAVGLPVVLGLAFYFTGGVDDLLLRRHLAGLTPEWGIGGVQPLIPGSAEKIKSLGPGNVPRIIQLLDDSNARVAAGALVALAFFPEQADLSIPVLLKRFEKAEEWLECQALGATLDRLLPKGVRPPDSIVQAINDPNPYRKMIAVDLLLARDPGDEAGKNAIVEALKGIEPPRENSLRTGSHETMVPAYHALELVKTMKPENRAFAEAELQRIRTIPTESIAGFSELVRFRDAVQNWQQELRLKH